MGYHISKKNLALLTPYLRILEKANQDVTFQSSTPIRLQELFRNAVNTTHTHLKDKYKFRVINGAVLCEYVCIDIELGNVVTIPVDLLRIADDILKENYPIKYMSVELTEEELSSLNSILPPHLIIIYNSPILEINYGTGT